MRSGWIVWRHDNLASFISQSVLLEQYDLDISGNMVPANLGILRSKPCRWVFPAHPGRLMDSRRSFFTMAPSRASHVFIRSLKKNTFETTSQNMPDSFQEAAFHVLTVIHSHRTSKNQVSLWRRYTIPKKDTKSIFDRLNEVRRFRRPRGWPLELWICYGLWEIDMNQNQFKPCLQYIGW